MDVAASPENREIVPMLGWRSDVQFIRRPVMAIPNRPAAA